MSSHNSEMDVDGASGNAPGPLKRCSSAPMINESSSTTMNTTSSTSSTPSPTSFCNLYGSRTRRFSASFTHVPGSPLSGRRTPNTRINQIRQEEHEVSSNSRELAHEKEVHNAMQISQSWEDLRLIESPSSDMKMNRMGPINVHVPSMNFIHNSISPTRYGFQSPTRTRQTFLRRSESPVFRPSPLQGVKRKLEEKDEFHASPRVKRVYSYSASDSRGLLTTTSNSLPGSLSSVGTPESLSSADSPGSGYTFRNVDDSPSPTLQTIAEPMIMGKNDHDMAESPS